MACKRYEHEFLPAALEVQGTPPAPLSRAISWSLMILFCITLLWAYFGEVDIVAVAQGKITPGGNDKVIQAVEIGVVRQIHVSDGQQVKAGAPLIELDTTVSHGDKQRAEKELARLNLESERLRTLLADVESASSHSRYKLAFMSTDNEPSDSLQIQTELLSSEKAEYHAQLRTIESQLQEHSARPEATQKTLATLEQTFPSVRP